MVHPGLRVGDLVELIDHQEVLLPDFQRGYVWRRPQILKFLDSLYRGYPIGQVLLWIPPQSSAEGDGAQQGRPLGTTPGQVAGSTIFASAERAERVQGTRSTARAAPPQFVLDGQQRLTTLYRILRGDEGSRVRFHAADEMFMGETAASGKDPLWVSVGDILGSGRGLSKALSRLQKELKLAPDDAAFERYQANLQRLALVRERVLPVDVVRLADPEQVAELFVRINSGTPLRRAELALAQLAWRWPGALVVRLGDALEEFVEAGFDFSAPFLMRCFVSVATGQPSLSNLESLWKLNEITLSKNWEKAHNGLRSTVAFVQEVARLPTGDDLPSLNTLVPMTTLFAKSIRLDAAQTQQLLYWFLVAGAFGRYGTNVEARLGEDLRAIYTQTPLKSLLENLERSTAAPAAVPPAELEGRGVGSGVYLLMASLLRMKGVQDWFPPSVGGRPPSPARGERDLVVQPIFSRKQLQDAGADPELSEEMANQLLLPHRPPSKWAQLNPEDLLGKATAQQIRDQWVPESKMLWVAPRAKEFLEARRVILAKAFTLSLEALHAGRPAFSQGP
ncbi:MAG: DUF262 domain-containing protein [Euryarchaeota archaeon]|nr:DUF262 domain-containing protein [Euryarchaeota archaeon]MDE2044304.1 DUF262 domain-containing protein [Thermoplasmata archaeon]